MRLGGRVTPAAPGPEEWIAAVQAKEYRAAYCPVDVTASPAAIAAYRAAAADADIVIAEVGVWNNPLAPDPAEAHAAYAKCVASLALADAMGARCCVNLAGSRSEFWAGHHPDNYADATFDLVAATTQRIIDEVQPRQTYYVLETMPWLLPYSIESYRRLVEAIDRPHFAVHFDPVNLVNSPALYYGNVILHQGLTVHLDETRPGTGNLALDVLLTQLATLDPDLPVMLEHLPTDAEYDAAAAHVRAVAHSLGLAV